MNEEDENIHNHEENEPEKFSDDPEEQLRIENELLRLQLQAETGADIHQLEDVPPEVEHAFLNNILAFERQLDSMDEISIFKMLGEPADFKPAEQLNDTEVETELERLVLLLREKSIEVDYGMEYPARLKYKFITEELFQHETQQFDIPDMVNHFIYEEFHPNHKLAIQGIAEEFLDMWLAKKLDDQSFIFGKEMVSLHHKTYSKAQFLTVVQHIFDAYLSLDNGSYEIEEIAFEENADHIEGALGYAEGHIRYQVTLESREEQLIEAPFKLYVVYAGGYWELINVVMPGLEL